MSERTSSLLIMIGGALIFLSVWGLSILAVRWDTQRRQMTGVSRQAWIGVALALPLFGIALYIAWRMLTSVLSPPRREYTPDEARMTGVQAQPAPVFANPPAVRPQSSPGNSSTNPVVRQRRGSRYCFVVLKGPHAGQQFVLNRLPVRIGRGADVGIALDADLKVSRSHADIYEWNGFLRIRDLHSTHGTHVNGATISDSALAPNDQVYMGATILLLREVS